MKHMKMVLKSIEFIHMQIILAYYLYILCDLLGIKKYSYDEMKKIIINVTNN